MAGHKFKHKNKHRFNYFIFVTLVFLLLNSCSLDRYELVNTYLNVGLTFSPVHTSGDKMSVSLYPTGIPITITPSGDYDSSVVKIRYTLVDSDTNYPALADPKWDTGTAYTVGSIIDINTSFINRYVVIKAVAYKEKGGFPWYSEVKTFQFHYSQTHGVIVIVKANSPAQGTNFTDTANITISCTNDPAEDPWTMRYTTNGTLPSRTVGTEFSTTTNFSISASTTIKVYAYQASMPLANDRNLTKTYTKTGNVAAIVFDHATGTEYPANTPLALSCITTGAVIRYNITTDGTVPASPGHTGGTVYTTPIILAAAVVKIAVYAYVEDWETSSDYNPSAVTYNCHQAPTPVFDKTNNSILNVGDTITLTSDQSAGITYYYTSSINGTPTDPDITSTKYTGSITVPDSTYTIKIFATKTGPYYDSPVATFTYKLRVPEPAVTAPSTSGTYVSRTQDITVTNLASLPSGSEVRYTGGFTSTPSNPTTSSTLYSSAIKLQHMYYKFRAFKTNWEPSNVISQGAFTVKYVYSARISGSTVTITRDDTDIHSFTVTGTLGGMHVNEGKIIIWGNNGSGSYIYVYSGGGVYDQGVRALFNMSDLFYTPSDSYINYTGNYSSIGYMSRTNTSPPNAVVNNFADFNLLESEGFDTTNFAFYNLIVVPGPPLTYYISARFFRTSDSKYCPGIFRFKSPTANAVADIASSSDSSCYAGRMAYDGSYLYVIGKQDSGTYFYKRVQTNLAAFTTQNFTTALKDISCYGSAPTTVIRILASNGTIYDENKTTYGMVSGATGIKMINAATWVIGTTSGYAYTENNGGNYTVFPVSGGASITDIGDYVN